MTLVGQAGLGFKSGFDLPAAGQLAGLDKLCVKSECANNLSSVEISKANEFTYFITAGEVDHGHLRDWPNFFFCEM